jgi:hypothetical protein
VRSRPPITSVAVPSTERVATCVSSAAALPVIRNATTPSLPPAERDDLVVHVVDPAQEITGSGLVHGLAGQRRGSVRARRQGQQGDRPGQFGGSLGRPAALAAAWRTALATAATHEQIRTWLCDFRWGVSGRIYQGRYVYDPAKVRQLK